MSAPRGTGRYEVITTTGEPARAFLLHPQPPSKPPLLVEGELASAHESALAALARLELAGSMVASVDWFVYGFVRKEAVLSPRIEGTQSTLLDLLAFEAASALGAVREGDWGGWVAFFLEAVATTADEAVATVQALFTQVSEDREPVLAAKTTSVVGLRLLEQLPQRPILTAQHAMQALDTTMPTALKAIDLLESLGILVETTGRQRDREYRYDAYLQALGADGAAPLEEMP